MARQLKTPGATTEAPKPEVVQTPVPAQDDAALDAILGTPDAKDAETTASTEPTSTSSEPVQEVPTPEELLDKQEYKEFLEWKKSKGAAIQPVAQHVPASGVDGAKRTRQVLTDDGWTSEDY